MLGDAFLQSLNPAVTDAVAGMEPEQIFSSYARHIGIGGIAMAGILGIIKSWPVIKGAVSLAGRELKGGNGAQDVKMYSIPTESLFMLSGLSMAFMLPS